MNARHARRDPSSYTEQTRQAGERLTAALEPATERERSLIAWLVSNFIPAEVDEWSAMVKRVRRESWPT